MSLIDGVPTVVPAARRLRVEPLPFRYPPDPDRAGERYVLRTDDGWLVGFNDGEFGGGLWWFNRDGKAMRRIRPSPNSPTNSDDYFHAENVLGMPEVGGERLVLMGLDHLTGRSGRIFRAVSTTTGWTLQSVVVLDAEPRVWLVADKKLLFVTESGLWSADATGARRIYDADLISFAPQSMVRATDGALYLGLRYYALKLDQHDGRWRQSWYVPADCQKVMLKDDTCECAK
jgi:hypothetical protein